jgi:uncharacterized membrane protein
MEELYHPLPQPEEISNKEKDNAMGGYFMMFASMSIGLPLPIINILAALFYYLYTKKKGRFSKFHSLQSLISQIPITILNAIVVVWFIRSLFLDLGFSDNLIYFAISVGLANIAYLVFSLIAAFRARKGYFYYFIFFGKVAYHHAYRIKPGEENGEFKPHVNEPPV